MSVPRNIRRLAFQALFQLDARGETDAPAVFESLEGAEGYSPTQRQRAFDLARAAYESRAKADAEFEALAPTWPASRQAASDRAILRLAHHEMCSGATHAVIAVNEAVELAKEFGTEKSPRFVNALLDKVIKRLEASAPADAPVSPDAPVTPDDTTDSPDDTDSPDAPADSPDALRGTAPPTLDEA